MSDLTISRVNIEDELKQSYLDYAMSVIVGRALPDIRDGLKPVHRRTLFAMKELGNDYNKPYKKSARIVGDVIGKYHPHGDNAVYDTIVRMAQPFSLRYPLVDGQGNFGSIDGDNPAAMRYTEVRMSKFAHTLLADIDKETVDFAPNYDGTEQIPVVLPTRVPNLLINGSSGIAVGMATNIPPHNLTETINACIAYIDNNDITIDELITHIPGPDFPTAGIISGRAGIIDAYKTGRGKIYIRARTHVEEISNQKQAIIITELPYQVNKARLVEKIAELVRHKKIEGISELRDESDKDGMRVVIELRRGEVPDVMLNNLYAHTQMQNVFGINMVALDQNQPKLNNLKDLVRAFVEHRQEVVTRRTVYNLKKARDRAHTLEGLTIALANIDEVIALIKAAKNPSIAKEKLLEQRFKPGAVSALLSSENSQSSRPQWLESCYGMQEDQSYRLSPQQAEAILALRLHRLTGLEQEKISDEYAAILKDIEGFLRILSDRGVLMALIKEELQSIIHDFGDERRTEITHSQHDLNIEDLITEEEMVVTLSRSGYVKTQPVSDYQAQHRGGRGKAAASLKEEDIIEKMAISSTHHTMLCFSSIGKVYWKKVYEFPKAGRNARGKPIVNLLPLEENETITAMLSVKEYDPEQFIVMATGKGVIKKTSLEAYSRPRQNGIWAINLDDDDALIGVDLTDGQKQIMLFSDGGKAVRFEESQARAMGRTAHGVRGIKLKDKQKVIAQIIIDPEEIETTTILTATEFGYGKRTPVSEYRLVNRGAQGVMSIQTSQRNGQVVSAAGVIQDDEAMLITQGGVLVRTSMDEISVIGRNTQGVRLIKLDEGETLNSVVRIPNLVEHPSLPDEALEQEDGSEIDQEAASTLQEPQEHTAQDDKPSDD